MSAILPVILSGGSGTRLWPLSRSKYPKQFIRFFNGQSASFLGQALARLKRGDGFGAPIVLCNNDHRFLVREELERAGIEAHAIILEPVSRNTAAAIAVAALVALKVDEDAVLVVMPSDHVVTHELRFVELVRQAATIAAEGKLVLFGIEPTEAHTGYGYIRRGAPLDHGVAGQQAFDVAAFVEKPDRAKAKTLLGEGGYDWNSGIFIMRARTFLDELARFEPEIREAAEHSLVGAQEDIGFLRLDATAFAAAPAVAVDRAVMERTARAVVIPADIGWTDVGSWTSLWSIASRSSDENFSYGDHILEDTSGCYIHSERGLVATIGVKDLVIVDTPDALLVTDRSRSQEVTKIVRRLEQSNRTEQERHVKNYRPWGFFETLNIGKRFQVKLLHVNPGGKLSMQMHHHRSEHWIVVQGTARIVIDDTERLFGENESVYIVPTQWHRLENPGRVALELIEVQIGDYLGEDDIVRTDDAYQRAPGEV